MPAWSVQLVKVGESEVRGPEAFWMDRWEEWVTLFFYVLVLRSPGRTIVLNAGPPDDLSAINRVWSGYLGGERGALRVADGERLPVALAAHGVDAADVDTVLLTPLTAYTTGRLDLFERAQLCISRAAWLDLLAPPGGANPAVDRSIAIHEPASDAAYRRGNVENVHPIGLARSLDEAHASYARIAHTADIFLPGFEPGLLDEFPDGRVA